MNLPCIDGSTAPFDLSKIATPVGVGGAGWAATGYAPATTLYNKMIANGVKPLPLATSGATAPLISIRWLLAAGRRGYPIIKGFIKIEEQTAYGNPCGTWKDVTLEILSYGYVGRNIDPVPQSLDGNNMNPQWDATQRSDGRQEGSPNWPYLPLTNAAPPAPNTIGQPERQLPACREFHGTEHCSGADWRVPRSASERSHSFRTVAGQSVFHSLQDGYAEDYRSHKFADDSYRGTSMRSRSYDRQNPGCGELADWRTVGSTTDRLLAQHTVRHARRNTARRGDEHSEPSNDRRSMA